MNKIACCCTLTLTAVMLGAAEPAPVETANPPPVSYHNMLLSFLPGTYDRMADVIGLKVGAPFCGGGNSVYGIEAALFGADSKYVSFLQASCAYAEAEEVEGIQFSPVAVVGKCNGLQMGLLGAANEINGVQLAPVAVTDGCEGLQLGLVNVADKSSFQLGLVNYNRASLLPWSILFNCCF